MAAPDTSQPAATEPAPPTAERAREQAVNPGGETLPHPPLMNRLVSLAVIVAALYFGRDLLMPLALAILVGFVLDPLVSWLKRRGIPRALAVLVVLTATLTLLVAGGFFVYGQMRQMATNLPSYEQTITRKLRSFGETLRQPGVLDQYSRVVDKVEKEIDKAQRAADAKKPAAERPAKVEVVGQTLSPWDRVGRWIERFATPLALVGIVVVFVFLILLDKGDLRDRALRLLGGNLHRTTDALNEAGRRVSRYLGMQLLVNATYGIPMALGLLLIGVPGALVWGLLAAVLRFVPYIGPIIGAIFPLTLAFAVDPGWNMVLWTLALIVTLELISNNVIEPWLYGASTGLATLSLIVAAMFWTAIWGPIGLILSTPITVVLLVLGQHLPQLQFLEVLLGSEHALDEPTRLHQRLLAGDVEEAIELAAQRAGETSPRQFYDQVGLGALQLASSAHGSEATAEHHHRVVSGMARVIEDLREQHPVNTELPVRVACIGGRWTIDALAADMAAHVLALQSIGSRVVPPGEMTSEYFARLDLQGVELVCLSYFSTDPSTLAKYFVRRLQRRWPEVRVVVAAWSEPSTGSETLSAQQIGAAAVVGSMEELLAQVQQLLAGAAAAPYAPAPLPDDESERLRALHDSGILDPALRGRFDAIARRAADAFDCAVAQVSLLERDWQLTHGDSSASGRPEQGAPERSVPRAESLCAHVVADAGPLVVPDTLRDPRFGANPVLKERGLRFYAGVPLRQQAEGPVLGTLCLLDTEPRQLSARDVLLLEHMADEVMRAVQEQAAQRAGAAAGDTPALAPS
ncbi:AI-2E family transporter [Ottowia sp.]|uniref:AI-2E family transporter n=1 Tax=Ottowia sp. TaxID=1898956 RepID=UPI002BA2FBEA|nr:AI-2E family transporter [Ottowia sp.]HRN77479.1 AI-2E family transporter [Ottowia sp.]HRQ04252.1 AI-2E family transporter [Ottowia sp.]